MTIKEFVAFKKEELKGRADAMPIKPHFVIMQVNDDEASNAYVKGKMKDAEEIGVLCTLMKFDIAISQDDLLKEIKKVNDDNNIHGLIVQMPLPKQINEEIIKLAVSPDKDIDGFHPLSQMDPCTPKGIILYLKSENFNFVGKNALVIGRSNIVGKPMAKLLLKEHCNVTVVHSRTTPEDMAFYIAHADIIVIAIGKAGFLDHHFSYKPTAIVVDVGINRIDGKLHGDAEKDLPVALQTPVPGGVGLLTRVTLINNLFEAFDNK